MWTTGYDVHKKYVVHMPLSVMLFFSQNIFIYCQKYLKYILCGST